ncbi:MAG: hypothetical protein AAFZ65_07825 [Planctomycetota bacterium]
MSARIVISLGAVAALAALVYVTLSDAPDSDAGAAASSESEVAGTAQRSVEALGSTLAAGAVTPPPGPAERAAVAEREPTKDELTGLRHAELVGIATDDLAALEALGRRINAFEAVRGPAYNLFMQRGTEEAAAVVNEEIERFRAELLEHYDPEAARLLAFRLRAVPVDPTNDD